MQEQNLTQGRLRVKVIGGGCAGFAYDLAFDERKEADEEGNEIILPALDTDPVGPLDTKLEEFGVTLIVDQMSLMYLRGTTIDYVETLSATGFKFNNPQVKSSCACGNSFSA